MITTSQPPEVEESVAQWSLLAESALAETGDGAGFQERWQALAGLGVLKNAQQPGKGDPAPQGPVLGFASSARRAGAAASGAVHRKAEDRPCTGRTEATPTTRRGAVRNGGTSQPKAGGVAAQTGNSEQALGPVTRAVAAVEGIGLAGAEPGLCYALASQRFGIQFPLLGLLGEEGMGRLGGVDTGKVLLCHALTEEGGGSDPLSMATRADRRPDGTYLLTGRKSFVTAAPVADVALVFARTTADRSPFALTPFLVDLHAPGVRLSAPFPKTALVDVPMGSIDFDGVRLTPDRMISEEGSGLALLTVTTTWERGLLLSYALGPMRRVLRRTVDWSGSREHFGRRMGSSHLVAARVAGMALAFYRSRELVYRIAARLDAGVRPRQLASDAALTKISVSEDYLDFSRHAAALGGVRSFIEDSGLTEDLTTPMAASTYAGPNDLLRVSVARDLGLPVEN